jgi:hypothetical protein
MEEQAVEVVGTEPRVVEPVRPAATTFVAGAGLAAMLRGRRARGGLLRRRRRRAVSVVATRSFLVDVHLLDPRR